MKNQNKLTVGILMMAFTMCAIAFYSKEMKVETVQAQEVKEAAPTETCEKIGDTTYCYDKLETLAWVLREEGKEQAVGTKIRGVVTQYSYADSCHNVVNGKCLMASGKPVYEGAVACPYFLKLGTKVRIHGKVYTCEDRYATWLDSKRGLPTFDMFVESNAHGLEKTDIEIL